MGSAIPRATAMPLGRRRLHLDSLIRSRMRMAFEAAQDRPVNEYTVAGSNGSGTFVRFQEVIQGTTGATGTVAYVTGS